MGNGRSFVTLCHQPPIPTRLIPETILPIPTPVIQFPTSPYHIMEYLRPDRQTTTIHPGAVPRHQHLRFRIKCRVGGLIAPMPRFRLIPDVPITLQQMINIPERQEIRIRIHPKVFPDACSPMPSKRHYTHGRAGDGRPREMRGVFKIMTQKPAPIPKPRTRPGRSRRSMVATPSERLGHELRGSRAPPYLLRDRQSQIGGWL